MSNTLLVVSDIIDKGRMKMGYDLVIIYKVLKYIKEHEGCSVKDLVDGVGMSFGTASKYVDFLREKELIEVAGLRPKRLYVTRRGLDYLFLMSRLENLLNIRIE